MKKILTVLTVFLLVFQSAYSSQKKSYVIGFYNLENLFDTYHDEGKNDYEYLPDGTNEWTESKYWKKQHNMARVIAAMAEENGTFHTILGVSEIENRHVLEDLVSQKEIAAANYQIVHYDGPDRRGVDVALLYRPENFSVIESRSIPFTFSGSDIEFSLSPEEQEDFRTRDILMVRGLLDGEMFAFFVAHLPSRTGGKGGDLRSRGAEIIYGEAEKLTEEFPDIKIVVMGDMNDNPTDVSMVRYLRGKANINELKEGDFFSPFHAMLRAGYGSLAYQGAWNIYDLILVNRNLAQATSGLRITPIVKKKYYGKVFKQPFMEQQEGQYKDQPKRTFSNGTFINGYSDHYPTFIVVSK